MARARLVGVNHVALEVADLDAALDFYGRLFAFELRGRAPGIAKTPEALGEPRRKGLAE